MKKVAIIALTTAVATLLCSCELAASAQMLVDAVAKPTAQVTRNVVLATPLPTPTPTILVTPPAKPTQTDNGSMDTSTIMNEVDPLGIIEHDLLLGHSISLLTEDQVEGETYKRIEYLEDDYSFVEYRFFPSYSFMGEDLLTRLDVYTPYGSDNIILFQYTMLSDRYEEEAFTVELLHQYINLCELYGTTTDCTYTSLMIDDSGDQDISFERYRSDVAADKQGIYSACWYYEDLKIMLITTIDPRLQNLQCSLSFAYH